MRIFHCSCQLVRLSTALLKLSIRSKHAAPRERSCQAQPIHLLSLSLRLNSILFAFLLSLRPSKHSKACTHKVWVCIRR